MNQEYITDVAYTSNYYGHLAPVWLNYIAAINGYAPRPLTEGFTYCELGCGNGLTTNLLAASNPMGRFWGVDMNPAHIVNARQLATTGGIDNVEFLGKSVADLGTQDLPEFDFIVLHGLYAWVSQSVRDQISAFIGQRLKPGGMVMVSYNSLPGWAPMSPLREMMRAYTRTMPGNEVEKARQGLAYLKFLKDNKAFFFENNPAAGKELERLLNTDLRYVAHEFFNPHWNPMYFSEVANDLAAAELVFAGSLPPLENYAQICIPQAFQHFFHDAPSRNILEAHKDFVRDTRFRNDVYVKGAAVADASTPKEELFEGMPFVLMVPADHVTYKGRMGLLEYQLENAIYHKLVAHLEQGPADLAQLHSAEALNSFTRQEVLVALQQLILTNQVAPGLGRMARGNEFQALNRELLRLAFQGNADHVVVPSSMAGAGVQLDKGRALVLWAMAEVGPENAPQCALEKTRALGVGLLAETTGAGAQPADEGKALAILARVRDEMTPYYMKLVDNLGVMF